MLVFSVCYPMVLQKYCRNLLPCILSYTWHLFYAGDDIIEDWVYLEYPKVLHYSWNYLKDKYIDFHGFTNKICTVNYNV